MTESADHPMTAVGNVYLSRAEWFYRRMCLIWRWIGQATKAAGSAALIR